MTRTSPALVGALERLDSDDSAQVGIVFGEGRSFSSGGDVNDRLQRSMDEGTTRGTDHRGVRRLLAVRQLEAGHRRGARLLPRAHAGHGAVLRPPRRCRDATFEVTEIKLGLPTVSVLTRLGRAHVRQARLP